MSYRNEGLRNAEAYSEMFDVNDEQPKEETYQCVVCEYITPMIFELGLCAKCWKENNRKWEEFRKRTN